MKPVEIISLFLVALGLLVAAVVIDGANLWSSVANYTIPWFCSALAIALLVTAAICLITGLPLREIDSRTLVVVWLVMTVGIGAGILIDAAASFQFAAYKVALTEWLGFAVMLAMLFWLGKRTSHNNGDDE